MPHPEPVVEEEAGEEVAELARRGAAVLRRRRERPQLEEVAPGRLTACHFWREVMAEAETTGASGSDEGGVR